MSQDFPRIYRLNPSGRRLHWGLGSITLALCAWGVMYFASLEDNGRVIAFLVGTCLVLAAGGTYLLLVASRVQVRLHVDSLELRGVFSSRQVARADISGYRLLPQEFGPPAIRFTVHRQRALQLPQFLTVDQAFADWLGDVPDVDAQERRASLQSVLADPALAGGDEEKLARLEEAQRVARRLLWVGLAATAWAWFWPRPYDVVMCALALLPWIAVWLAATNGAFYRLNPRHNDVGGHLTSTLTLPGFALMLRTMLDVSVLDGSLMFGWAVAGAILVALAIFLFVKEERFDCGSAAMTALLLLPYGFGLLGYVNWRLDRAGAEVHEVRVLEARRTTGSGPDFHLRLSPWGPRTEPEDVDVSRSVFDSVKAGDTVCVHVNPGALGVRWFGVWSCEG